MGNKVGRNMGLRLDTETSTDLDEFERVTGIEGTTLCRSALKAALDYWKKKGRISFPLVLVEPPESAQTPAPPKPLAFDYKGAVKSRADRAEHLAAENVTPYQVTDADVAAAIKNAATGEQAAQSEQEESDGDVTKHRKRA